MATAENQKFKHGFWKSNKNKGHLHIVDGEKAEIHNSVILDFPDTKPMTSGAWKCGDFGPIPESYKAITEATGAENYNIGMIYNL